MHNDYEKMAADIISIVKYGQRGGRVDAGVLKRVTEMLVHGPGITTWPRDEAEFCQRARDRATAGQRKPLVLPRVSIRPAAVLPRAAGMRPVLTLPRAKL